MFKEPIARFAVQSLYIGAQFLLFTYLCMLVTVMWNNLLLRNEAIVMGEGSGDGGLGMQRGFDRSTWRNHEDR